MNWLRYRLSSNSAVEQKIGALSDRMSSLIARESDVLTELEHAEIQPGKKQRKEVHQWLTAVQGKKDEVESRMKDGSPGKRFPNNSNLSDCIDRMIEEVDELIRQGKFPYGLVLPDQESTRLPLLVGKKIVGANFQQNYERILGWLQNHKHHIIGVYGMGGVGKTTLLLLIHNRLLQESSLYGRVYWVTVSQNWSVHKLQEVIANLLGMESFEEGDARKRAAILHNRLAANGPTVIILDDMWKLFSEDDVGIPLEASSCKIVLSTRSLELCRKMGCSDFVIKANILQEDEAWDLFVDKLRHYDILTVEAKQIARYVAEECCGLPLAITTMARSMSGIVDIHEWQNALNELKNVREQTDMEDDVLRILQYSYDRLNDKMVQNCFLSCILYPEDLEIKRKTLIDLWIDQGLLDEIESRKEQVVKGHAILNRLENLCLLESVFDRLDQKICVKMHDLIRDMAIMITRNLPCFMVKSGLELRELPEEKKWSEDLKNVSLSCNHIKEIPCGMAPVTPQIAVLMLSYNYELKQIPESFFTHMRSLTVLDLSHTQIETLPDSVSNLENLRALLLEGCEVLQYVSVAKLTKLRVLRLPSYTKSFNYILIPLEGIERLKHLEELTPRVWTIVDDVIRFNKLINSSQVCDIFWEEFWLKGKFGHHSGYSSNYEDHIFEVYKDDIFMGSDDYILKGYDKRVRITSMVFNADCEHQELPILPSTIKVLVLRNISALKYESLENLLPSLAGAKELKILLLKECKGLEYIIISEATQPDSFIVPSLDTLELLWVVNMPDLRGLTNSLSVATFSHIKKLFIRMCPKLKVVFPYKLLQQERPLLSSIEYLEVHNCENLEEVFEGDSSICSSYSSTQSVITTTLVPDPSNACYSKPNPISAFPNLRTLELGNLPKLRKIYRDLHLCTSLEKVSMANCLEIEELFLYTEPTFALPSLRILQLKGLPKLSSIYRGLLLCTSLQLLNVEDCSKLKRLQLSTHLSCDASPTALLSLPLESEKPELWELLRRNYPVDTRLLSEKIRYHQTAELKMKRKWGTEGEGC